MEMIIWSWMLAILVLLNLHKTQTKQINVAQGKPAKQVDSIMNHGVLLSASKAVDGKTNQTLEDHSCTHTWSKTNTWWIVDLLVNYEVFTLRLTNRISVVQKLQDFWIYVATANPLPIPARAIGMQDPLCIHYAGIIPKNGPQVVNCSQALRGQFVYVWKPRNGELTLCEFEVLVPENKRERSCGIRLGQRSLLNVSYSSAIAPVSMFRCLLLCMSTPGIAANTFQVNKVSGICECIEYSSLVHSSFPTESHRSYDICY